jgi:hypothetical protein
MNRWVWPLVIIAAAGLVSSLVLNTLARRGEISTLGSLEAPLFIGCFLAVISGFYLTGLHDKSKTLQQYWKLVRTVLTACPVWLRYAVITLWVYGLLNAVTSIDLSFEPSSDRDVTNLINLSGGFMMLYSMSLAMLYPSTDPRLKAEIDRVRNEDVGV